MSDRSKISLPSQKARTRLWLVLPVAAVVVLGATWLLVGQEPAGAREPVTAGGPPMVRRLGEEQYKRSIQVIFGEEIEVPGRFDPPVREEGLIAIGGASAVVTQAGLEQNVARAQRIAAQVVSEERRDRYVQCELDPVDTFDEPCATDFFTRYGQLLFRRPVTEIELTVALEAARQATDTFESFYKGLEYGLVSQLVSPAFLYRIESTEPDPDSKGASRLDGYSLASRISFLLWDAPPDEELLTAAGKGELFKQETLQQQVDRMVASPRFEDGVRAFFWDNFGYDRFDGLVKDTALFPLFSPQLRNDAQEQSMRTIVDHLITQNRDYRELFTTNQTFLNRNLGSLFRVPVHVEEYGGWVPYTFEPEHHRAGLLTLPAFLMLDPSHEGRSSPTIRGKMVRELFLCQVVPPPPGDVNFDLVEDVSSPLKTARERLARHNEDPVCSGCHAVTDPIGLSYENYDAIGQYRTHENGAVIDASGNFEGVEFDEALGLQHALADSDALTSCLARRTYEYGVGRRLMASEFDWMDYIQASFADTGYRFVDLIRLVATSKAFRTVTPTSSSST